MMEDNNKRHTILEVLFSSVCGEDFSFLSLKNRDRVSLCSPGWDYRCIPPYPALRGGVVCGGSSLALE
jgi:hypothetical protein